MKHKPASGPEHFRLPSLPRLAIGLIGASTLLLEILLTRIFSVTMWYHFAFVAISLALFGIAASGAAVTIAPGFFRRAEALRHMGFAAIAMGVTIPISFVLDLQIPLAAFDVPAGADGAGPLKPYALFFAKFVVLSLPFFFGGLVIALAFTHFPHAVHRTYSADLVGGALGCVLVIPFLWGLSGPSAVISVAALAFAAGSSLLRRDGLLLASGAAAALAVGVVIFSGLNEGSGFVKITHVKSYGREEIQVKEPEKLYERWHPVSRVAVFSGVRIGPRPWFYSRSSSAELPHMLSVTNDAGARTYLYKKSSRDFLTQTFRDDMSDLMYHVMDEPSVLVLGVGGGKDVLSALTLGSSKVTAVELNPLMIELSQQVFADFTGAPYDDPRVTIVIDEGRNYIASHDETYDLIKISVTDTWTASAMGAYALTENYLYTVEAIQDFMAHLKPGGFLSIVRWYPQESLRLASLSATALRENGISDPRNRIVMVRNPKTMNLTIKNGVWSTDELSTLRQQAARAGLVWVGPGGTVTLDSSDEEKVDGFHRAAIATEDSNKLEARLPFSIEPPRDDRPFFFSPVGLNQASNREYFSFSGFTFQHGRALSLLIGLLKVTLVVAFGFVVLPLLLRKSSGFQGVSAPARLWSSLYFLMLGFGYLLIEIPLLQQFILFLGHPTYAVTVVLFSLLISSGTGSLLAEKLSIDAGRAIRLVFPALLGVAVLFTAILPSWFPDLIGLPFALRVAVAVAVMVPLGLLLGIPFPVGVAQLHRSAPSLVPWAWAVNGAASVAAPVIAMILGISAGFSIALYTGIGCYVAAAGLLWALSLTSVRVAADEAAEP